MTSGKLLTTAANVLLFIAEADRPSREEIAAGVGTTPDNVYRLLVALEREGYITRHVSGPGMRNRYEVHPDKPLRDRSVTVGQFVRLLGRAD